MVTMTLQAKDELAPSSRLRAAINLGNGVLAQTDPTSGTPKGLSVDLARELASRLSVPIDIIPYNSAGNVFDALKSDEWDIAFLAIDAKRAAAVDFTAPHVLIEGSYVVRNESTIKAMADVDQPGVRISLTQGSGYDLYLTRAIKQATLVRSPTGEGALENFLKGGLEALAGVKQALVQFMKGQQGLRLVEPRFMSIEHAMATPKGRPVGAAYLKAFVEEMKGSGFVATALQRSGQAGAVVAPPQAE